MNMFKKNGGFTLVELIVVIAILAILAAVAVPAYNGYIGKAQEASDVTALAAVKTACMATYATEGTVTKIIVTEGTPAAGETPATAANIQVWLNGDEAKTGADAVPAKTPAGSDDFKTFYNIADGASFSIDLATGTKATWTAGANSDWVIE